MALAASAVAVGFFGFLNSNSLCRHHPRKRVIQYSRALMMNANALEYWVARSSRAMTTACASAFSRHSFVVGFPFRSLPQNQEGARDPQERARATLKRGRGEDRVRAAPAVSCAIDAQGSAHTSIQVQRKHSGLPCAMALRLIRALPGDLDLLVTVTSVMRTSSPA
jgi:hypothetical protein